MVWWKVWFLNFKQHFRYLDFKYIFTHQRVAPSVANLFKHKESLWILWKDTQNFWHDTSKNYFRLIRKTNHQFFCKVLLFNKKRKDIFFYKNSKIPDQSQSLLNWHEMKFYILTVILQSVFLYSKANKDRSSTKKVLVKSSCLKVSLCFNSFLI